MAISFPAVSIGETLFPESAHLCRLKKVSVARLTGARGWSLPGRTGREKEMLAGWRGLACAHRNSCAAIQWKAKTR